MGKSGVLLHISSLPSPYGIGAMGRAAYAFADFVADSGMSVWQVLPVGPTGYGDSPYQAFSTFAGNPNLIDLELLVQEGILAQEDLAGLAFGSDPASVEYGRIVVSHDTALRRAFARAGGRLAEEVEAFAQGAPWLADYALFMAVKAHFGGVSFQEWPDEAIRLREPAAMAHYGALLAEEIQYIRFAQYLFFKQWRALKAYANARGVKLLGDMPIYVAPDSSDLWANPELFLMDEARRPSFVAGVPPDYFSAEGQLWGNPIYDWEAMEREGYTWWIARLRAMCGMFDMLRIDHFIGFARYYAIPAGAANALSGEYRPGPGMKLFRAVRAALGELPLVAEDLGVITPEVEALLKEAGFPGMRVLQFAYDSDERNMHLPENIGANTVLYTGTHDNATTVEWWAGAGAAEKAFVRRKLGMHQEDDDIAGALIRAAYGSTALLCIIPMQDYLRLGAGARMNEPSTLGGNWRWRMLPGAADAALMTRILCLNKQYRRTQRKEERMDCKNILRRMEESLQSNYQIELHEASTVQLHNALSEAVMMELSGDWRDSRRAHERVRRAYYVSAEYLVGRMVFNNLYCLGILSEVRDMLRARGADITAMEDIEDEALGNGGLGRLAACFLDSAATHNIPLDGYGLRYKFGLFKQSLENGYQVEKADDWQRFGDPWSRRRDDRIVTVEFADQKVLAVPYDMPIVGYRTRNIGTLRLWQSEPIEEFDFRLFNDQEYALAVREKNSVEDITRVLYPNDSTYAGKRLRLKQQYFLSSASMQDIIRRYKKVRGANGACDFSGFAAHCAVQLNDTHPTVSIPELIRLLMLEGLEFDAAFDIARETFSYTNHTIMSEALEKWELELFNSVVPKLGEIICRINDKLNAELRAAGVNEERRARMQIVADNTIHMARLAVYVSTYVNGVARIHTEILKNDVFRDWYEVYPRRFQNKTNGITQRRWLGLCNPELAGLIAEQIGDGFLTDLNELGALREKIDDDLIARFNDAKHQKKRQLAAIIKEREGVELPTDFVFDIQVKRMHEYKRQLLNAFSILDIYFSLKDGILTDFTPTAFIFGAKAAPGYWRAKSVIKFINEIAKRINNDPDMRDKMRVVFVQNYNCSYAEHIIPAADISEQISPAGTEASGTGNMKFMLNGTVTLGTYDGANIEIVEQAGEDNNYIFGARVEDIARIRDTYNPKALYDGDARMRRVVDTLIDGTFSDDNSGAFRELYSSLLFGASWHAPDHYYLLLDFHPYMEAKLRANRDYRDSLAFGRKCLMNTASAGMFSSDRTIKQYAEELWHLPRVEL